LATQDPFTFSPTERSRYESLFPEYAKEDGFVYGSEAVGLFGKSGLPPPQLATIWHMVDVPIDNRLDKLEFAMAMHLIVCVTKKGLPMPPGLPMSLKQLKSQQQPQQSTPPRAAPSPPQQQQMQAAPSPQPHQMQMQAPPATASPPRMQQQPPQSMSPQMQQQQPRAMPDPPSLQGPPPLTRQGPPADIHDAFEGLESTTNTGMGGYMASNPTMSSMDHSERSAPMQSSIPDHSSYDMGPTSVQVETVAEPAPAAPMEPPKTTQQLGAAYQMGDSNEELVKLKVILQKLQAENISLKASMSGLSEDERHAQQELMSTVHEVSNLSNKLTTLRAQVLASKARLMEATSELKAAKEKKGYEPHACNILCFWSFTHVSPSFFSFWSVLTDLISEAAATKHAINEATEGIEQATSAVHQIQQPPPPAAFEADLFGFGGSPPAPAQSYDSTPAPAQSYDSTPAPAQSYEYALPPAPAVAYEYAHPPAPAQAYEYAPPIPNPSPPRGIPEPEPTSPNVETITPSYAASYATEDELAAHHVPPPAPSFSYGFDPNSSIASIGFGGVMGGDSLPSDPHAERTSHGEAPSMAKIEEMKSKLKEAEDIARDSAESRRQMTSQVDELRRVADEAEAKARQHKEDAEGKGKRKGLGLLAKRGIKKDAVRGRSCYLFDFCV
jgi:hypothetical protein